MQTVTPNAANFVWQTNFFLGEGAPKIPLKEIAQRTGKFGPKTPFAYISALFGPLYDLFGPFLTLFNAKKHHF